MTIFDLIFLLAMLATALTLLVAIVFAIRGRFRTVLRIACVYAICAAVYVGLGVAVSAARPQRAMSVGDSWCFDDWCLAVNNVSSSVETAGLRYQVGLRVFSRARRVSQRAKGAWIYLVDENGRLYPPEPNAADVPLDVLLRPDESVTTSRTFRVPGRVRRLGLITGHGGAYCGAMSFLIIGDTGCMFNKPPMIRIQ